MHDEPHPAGSVAPDAGPRSRVKGSTSSANIDAHRGLDPFSGVTVHTGLIMRSHRVHDLLNFTVCSSTWASWTFLDKSWEAVAHSLRLQPAVCKWTQWHASQPRPLPTFLLLSSVSCIEVGPICNSIDLFAGGFLRIRGTEYFYFSILRWQVSVNGLELTQ